MINYHNEKNGFFKNSLVIIFATSFWGLANAQEYKTINHIPSQSLIENIGVRLQAADSNQARPLPEIALELIKEFEGWEPKAYNDPSGYCTIGYGHLIALKRCQDIDLGEFEDRTLTVQEGETILEKDTYFARMAVTRLVSVDINENQFGALSSFVFNVGETNFSKSTLLLLLNDGHTEKAAGQFGRWIKSKGIVLEGLRQRRACSRSLFEGYFDQSLKKPFSRQDCMSFGISDTVGEPIDIEHGER